MLQHSLNSLHTWCLDNKLPLNIQKCIILSFTLKQVAILFDYALDRDVIERRTEISDLGVTFHSDMSFTSHMNKTVSAAFKLCGLIYRNTRSFSVNTLLYLYKTLIIPKLEYGAVIWSPHSRSDIRTIEGVQRHIMKMCYFRAQGSFPPISISNTALRDIFDLSPLMERRQGIELKFLKSIWMGKINCPDLLQLFYLRVPRLPVRGIGKTFYLPIPRTDIRKYSPLFRICGTFESSAALPDLFGA